MEENMKESQLEKQNLSLVSVFTSGIGTRISELSRLVGGKKKLAEIASISESQLHRYVAGQSQPTIEPIAAMSHTTGVSLDWLATGKGSMHISGDEAATLRPGTLDRDIMTDVIRVVTEELSLKGVFPEIDRVRVLMLLLHDEIYESKQQDQEPNKDKIMRLIQLVV